MTVMLLWIADGAFAQTTARAARAAGARLIHIRVPSSPPRSRRQRVAASWQRINDEGLEVRLHLHRFPQLPSSLLGWSGNEDRVACRGGAATGSQTSAKGVRRCHTVVQSRRRAAGAGPGGGGQRRSKDAMCQAIGIIGRRDVIAHHAALAGGRCPGRGHATENGLRADPGAAGVRRREEANTQIART